MVDLLLERGESVAVLDDLSRGHRESVHPSAVFYEGKIGDRELVGKIVRTHGVKSCIHFAALAYVGESVEMPARYFEKNVAEGKRLLCLFVYLRANPFFFSSTLPSL